MTHEDAGHYGAKHPEGARPDPELADRIRALAGENGMDCVRAHALAAKAQIPPQEVGKTLDLLELRIASCQLGLFGYGDSRKIVEAAPEVSPPLRAAILVSARAGRLSCAGAWKIATAQGCSRLDVARACEALAVKITHCQLGAF